MGWLIDDGRDDSYDHEGYVVGLVKDDPKHTGFEAWRELGADDRRPIHWSNPMVRLYIQVGCSCGWRSQRLVPPVGTEWMPCCVVMDEEHSERAAAVWEHEHRRRLPECDGYRSVSLRQLHAHIKVGAA